MSGTKTQVHNVSPRNATNQYDSVVKIANIRPYTEPTREQISKVKSSNLIYQSKDAINQVTQACFISGETQHHGTLRDTVRRVLRRKIQANIDAAKKEFYLARVDSDILPVIKAFIKPTSVFDDHGSVKLRPSYAIFTITQSSSDEKGSSINVSQVDLAKSFVNWLTIISTTCWAGFNYSYFAKLETYGDITAEILADQWVSVHAAHAEAANVALNCLAQAEELKTGLEHIISTSAEYDESVNTALTTVIDHISKLMNEYIRHATDETVMMDSLLRHALSDEKVIINGAKNKCHTIPTVPSEYYEVSDMIYQRVLMPGESGYTPSIYASHCTDAKVLRALIASGDSSTLKFTLAALGGLGAALELLQWIYLKYGSDSLTADLVISIEGLTHDPSQIPKPGIYVFALASLMLLTAGIKCAVEHNKHKIALKKIEDAFYNNINTVLKTSSECATHAAKAGNSISSLEASYKKLMDSSAKCHEGLNPQLAQEHIDIISRCYDKQKDIIDLKIKIANNSANMLVAHKCCMNVEFGYVFGNLTKGVLPNQAAPQEAPQPS